MMLSIAKFSFCLVALVFAFLSQIPLFGFDFQNMQFEVFYYSPALIFVFMMSRAFKNNYAFIALILILIAVLFGIPLFSFGGGWQYIFQPSFGYVIAMIIMSVTIFYQYYHSQDKEFLLQKSLLTLFLTHLFGIVFFLCFSKLDFMPFKTIFTQMLFDMIFAMIFIWLYKKEI